MMCSVTGRTFNLLSDLEQRTRTSHNGSDIDAALRHCGTRNSCRPLPRMLLQTPQAPQLTLMLVCKLQDEMTPSTF